MIKTLTSQQGTLSRIKTDLDSLQKQASESGDDITYLCNQLKNWEETWTHTFSKYGKSRTNRTSWKPYESVHNWFSGLKYASSHLTSQAGKLLDRTKTHA